MDDGGSNVYITFENANEMYVFPIADPYERNISMCKYTYKYKY